MSEVEYDPELCARLVAEAREDDDEMTGAPWACDFAVTISDPENAAGIARSRNNLRTIADQLEAAVRMVDRTFAAARERIDPLRAEVERLKSHTHLFDDHVDGLTYCSRCGWWDGAANQPCTGRTARLDQAIAERDTLRQQLEAAGREIDNWRRAIDRMDAVLAQETAERRALRQQLEAVRAGFAMEIVERDRRDLAIRQALHASDAEITVQAADRVVAERDEALADGVLSQRVCDLENDRAQLRSDLAAAQQRIAELESRQQELLATIVRLTNETPFPDEIKDWPDTQAKLVAEVGTMRARVRELEEHHDTWRTRAQMLSGRVAELEDKVAGHVVNASNDLATVRKQDAELAELLKILAALRAVWPVYRAAVELDGEMVPGERHRNVLSTAVGCARAALTPDLIAALQAAGLEVE